ncbi:hypothetical protein [Shewanella sp. S1-58-MNA-CIBAN-0166]|uniref:hypothetical protein n=1 Tax=Shewanella sp. S1-58-MNA-CIBAN-0166 TaxID=3140467 RepID=UPI0033228C89
MSLATIITTIIGGLITFALSTIIYEKYKLTQEKRRILRLIQSDLDYQKNELQKKIKASEKLIEYALIVDLKISLELPDFVIPRIQNLTNIGLYKPSESPLELPEDLIKKFETLIDMHKKANQMSENILQKNNLLSIESALELHLQYLRFFELITYLHSSKNNLKNFVFDE